MTAIPAMPFERRVRAGESLLGLLVRLPVGDRLFAGLDRRFSFVVVDLVVGPHSEVEITRLAEIASPRGLAVIALIDDSLRSIDVARLRRHGIDGVVGNRSIVELSIDAPSIDDVGHQPSDQRSDARSRGHDTVRARGRLMLGHADTGRLLHVVHSVEQARRNATNGPLLVALDVEAASSAMLESFADEAASPTDREAVVMLPGMLGDARVFAVIADVLDGHVVCRPQRIDLDDTIAGIADSVLAMSPQRFALVGHSLGAIVALEVYRRAPTRVTRLALLNASARPASDGQLAAWTMLGERTERGEFSTIAAEQAAVNVGPAGSAELRSACVDMARRIGPEGFQRQLHAQASRPDSRPTLAAVGVPTLVVSGSHDAVCPTELQAELVSGIAAGGGAVVHETIEGAGHMSPLDHPAEVAAHLLAWLGAPERQ